MGGVARSRDMRPNLNPIPFRFLRSGAAAMALWAALLPTPVQAQPPAPHSGDPSSITVRSAPAEARIFLKGSNEIAGISPFDLSAQWIGRYAVTIEASGYATAR